MKVYFTSDTHSYILPTDYLHPVKMDMGYAHLASAFTPGSVVLDGGDVLQGSPLIRYALKSGSHPLPPSLAFNAAGLDVYVPGNHDFDFGYDVLSRFLAELDARAVSANIEDERGELGIERHVVIERAGIRLFITGAVTDYVNIWNPKIGGLRITDSVEALSREAEAMKAVPHDFSICIYHGGFGDERGDVKENRADEIARLGFDYLLTAHQHQLIEPHAIGNTIVLQAGYRAEWAAELDLSADGTHSERLVRCSCSTPLSASMKDFIEKCSDADESIRSLSSVIGKVDGILEDRGYVESALNGSTLADFINDIQLRLTGADVSVASLANNFTSIGPDVILSDVLASYPFSNSLVLLRMKASDLREAMERSAEYIDVVDGHPVVSPSFAPGKNERYNFDFFRGLSYTFDYTKDKGGRVVRMMRDGVDLLSFPDTILAVAVNSYRATGTGRYGAYKKAEVIRNYSSEDMQQLLIDALSSYSVKVPVPTDFSSVAGS